MRIQPKDNFQLLGTNIKLDKTKTYVAKWANNQPDYIERGCIFVFTPNGSMMLEGKDFELVG